LNLNIKLKMGANLMFKKLSILGMAMTIALSLGGQTKAADAIELKLATFEPPHAFAASAILKAWAEKIGKDSGGRLKVKVFAGGVLGKPPQQYDIVKGGVADIAWTVLGYIGGQFPLSSVVELPFMTTSSKGATRALNTLYEEGYLDNEFKGVKNIGLHTMHSFQFHFRDKNVTKVSQFKGMKMRVPSKVLGKILTKLGATPVRVPAPGSYEALQRGVLDGTPFPYAAVGSFRLGDVTKYHSEINISNASFGLLMNEKKYNSLPDDLKKVIDANSGHAFGDWAAALIDANDAKQKEAIAAMEGHEISVISGADLDEYKSLLSTLNSEWLDEMKSKDLPGDKVLKRAMEVIAEAN
jgi:TRAP-type C4-dicarboxylate transport system substrate-binding protein